MLIRKTNTKRTRYEAEDAQPSTQKRGRTKNRIDRENWKSHDFLVEQFHDIDDLYFDGYFRLNGWKDEWVKYDRIGMGVLGCFSYLPVFSVTTRTRENCWVNQRIGFVSTGISIGKDTVFNSLHDLRDTLAHEMCHALTFMQYTDLREVLESNREGGHGKRWRDNADVVNRKSVGIDDLGIKRFADSEKAMFTVFQTARMSAEFCYYYIDMDDNMSNLRFFRTNKPQIGFEDAWDFMHDDPKAKVQSRLMLVKASDAFISTAVGSGYEDFMETLKNKSVYGRFVSTADPFTSGQYGASNGVKRLLDLCRNEDMSYVLDGKRVEPIQILEEWTLDELRDED
jgi:hypothetical protein